jgi:hypothetical protein
MSTQEEAAIEEQVVAARLTWPRVTPADVDSQIVGETYTVLPSGRTTICELTLKNGFTVTGESAVVSKENFNEIIGQEIARRNAREKIWMLEGYALRNQLMAVQR